MHEQDSRNYPVHEDMRLQRAFWTWARAMWGAIALIVLIALSGVFANGPLSKTTVTDSGLALTYERFQRVTAVSRLTAANPHPMPRKPA